MFSFFDYLRRQTSDSILAGMYDAYELIEARNAEEQTQAAESLLTKFDTQAAPKAIGPVESPAPRPNSPPTGPPRQEHPPGSHHPRPTDVGHYQPRKRGRPPKGQEGHR